MRLKTTLFLLVATMSFLGTQAGKTKFTKIVLDAGHGGTDPGARGQISDEKDLTLGIALRVGKLVQDSLKGVSVVYTRTTDIYPKLPERHAIANRESADLFISIHINSTAARVERVNTGYKTITRKGKKIKVAQYQTIRHRETSTTGTESYVLGLHRNNQKEDAISEGLAEETGLLNENDPQTDIIIAQYSQAFLSRSVSFAQKVQSEFERQGRRNLGVKQKGLEVLAGSAMPGVLVECGFINNPEEEAYMNSEKGQQEIAYGIFKAIRAYKIETER